MKRNSYAQFGEAYAPTVIDGTGYTGHVMDQATGLTYMQQRYYDPALGRFLSKDPVSTDPNTGASFNPYDYAYNNPYQFTDPDGRRPGGRGDGKDHRTISEKVKGKIAQAAIKGQSRRNASSGTNSSKGSQPSSDNSLTAKQVVEVANADVTLASVANLAIESNGGALDKLAAKSFGTGLSRAGALGGSLEMLNADSPSEFVHGAVMSALVLADGTPLAPAAIGVQAADLGLQLTPEYESKIGLGSANGWTGAGLMMIDAAASIPYQPVMH